MRISSDIRPTPGNDRNREPLLPSIELLRNSQIPLERSLAIYAQELATDRSHDLGRFTTNLSAIMKILAALTLPVPGPQIISAGESLAHRSLMQHKYKLLPEERALIESALTGRLDESLVEVRRNENIVQVLRDSITESNGLRLGIYLAACLNIPEGARLTAARFMESLPANYLRAISNKVTTEQGGALLHCFQNGSFTAGCVVGVSSSPGQMKVHLVESLERAQYGWNGELFLTLGDEVRIGNVAHCAATPHETVHLIDDFLGILGNISEAQAEYNAMGITLLFCDRLFSVEEMQSISEPHRTAGLALIEDLCTILRLESVAELAKLEMEDIYPALHAMMNVSYQVMPRPGFFSRKKTFDEYLAQHLGIKRDILSLATEFRQRAHSHNVFVEPPSYWFKKPDPPPAAASIRLDLNNDQHMHRLNKQKQIRLW